jgi:hypothetical protein
MEVKVAGSVDEGSGALFSVHGVSGVARNAEGCGRIPKAGGRRGSCHLGTTTESAGSRSSPAIASVQTRWRLAAEARRRVSVTPAASARSANPFAPLSSNTASARAPASWVNRFESMLNMVTAPPSLPRR